MVDAEDVLLLRVLTHADADGVGIDRVEARVVDGLHAVHPEPLELVGARRVEDLSAHAARAVRDERDASHRKLDVRNEPQHPAGMPHGRADSPGAQPRFT